MAAMLLLSARRTGERKGKWFHKTVQVLLIASCWGNSWSCRNHLAWYSFINWSWGWGVRVVFTTLPSRSLESHLIKIPALLTQWKRNSYSCVFAYSVQELRLSCASSLCMSFGYEWPKAWSQSLSHSGRPSIAEWPFPRLSSELLSEGTLKGARDFKYRTSSSLFLGKQKLLCAGKGKNNQLTFHSLTQKGQALKSPWSWKNLGWKEMTDFCKYLH